ncbi:hypothetical protein AOLI_G00069590, partial [Acnodon oligacanthus]
FHEYGKSPSPSSSSLGSSSSSAGRSSFESRVPDVATVPDHDSKPSAHEPGLPHCPPHTSATSQDYAGVLNMAVAQAKPTMLGHPLYAPYGSEQALGQWASGTGSAQYPPPPPPPPPHHHPHHHHHLATDYSAQAVHHGYHHGNVGDWSQYPLFSYSCW